MVVVVGYYTCGLFGVYCGLCVLWARMTCCVVFVWCDLWVSVCLLWWFGLGRLLLGALVVLSNVFWFCGWIG